MRTFISRSWRSAYWSVALCWDDALIYLGQRACGLRGHAPAFQFAPTKLRLKCLSCGAVTPGWDLPRRIGRMQPSWRATCLSEAAQGRSKVLAFRKSA